MARRPLLDQPRVVGARERGGVVGLRQHRELEQVIGEQHRQVDADLAQLAHHLLGRVHHPRRLVRGREARGQRPVAARREAGDVQVALGDVGDGAQRDVPRSVAVGRERSRALVYVDVRVDDQQLAQRRAPGHRGIIPAWRWPAASTGSRGTSASATSASTSLTGAERTLLVDTGLRDMPRTVIAPYLDDRPIDDVFISHADVDHCGGNRVMRELSPGTRFMCGEADRPWIESNAAMLAGNYRWYETYGFGPSAEDVAFLEHELGGDAPIDVGLRGGETLRLGPRPPARGARAPRPHGRAPRPVGRRDRHRDRDRRGARRRRLRPRGPPPDPAALLRRRRLRGDDPPPARARSRPPADRALRRHGARRRARVPRPLARLRARRPQRGTRARARPTCAR